MFLSIMQAMEELFKQIEHLKEMHASGVKSLDGSAQELYEKSQMTLTRLSSELSVHSSLIMDVSTNRILVRFAHLFYPYKLLQVTSNYLQLVTKNSSDADAINSGLKSNMTNLGLKIDAFITQQQEV